MGIAPRSFSKAGQRPISSGSSIIDRKQVTSSETPDKRTSQSSWRPASILDSLWSGTGPKEATLEATSRPIASSNDEDEREGERTLKGTEETMPAGSDANPSQQNTRLSTLFSTWNMTDSTSSHQRKSRVISEPVQVHHSRPSSQLIEGTMITENTVQNDGNNKEVVEEDMVGELEVVMDLLGLKDAARSNMRSLSDTKKRILISQHRQTNDPVSVRTHRTGPEPGRVSIDASTTLPTSSNGISHLRHFSMAGWSGNANTQTKAKQHRSVASLSPAFSDTDSFTSGSLSPSLAGISPTPAPLLQTATGWTSWFSAGSPARSTTTSTATRVSNAKDTPAWYLEQLQTKRIIPKDLVKLLIALRVRLSTEPLFWISDFLDRNGIGILGELLKKVITKGNAKCVCYVKTGGYNFV